MLDWTLARNESAKFLAQNKMRIYMPANLLTENVEVHDRYVPILLNDIILIVDSFFEQGILAKNFSVLIHPLRRLPLQNNYIYGCGVKQDDEGAKVVALTNDGLTWHEPSNRQ